MNSGIFNILSSVIGEYLSLRADNFKKELIAGLSVALSRALALIVIMTLVLITLALFAYAFFLLLGELMGSMTGAAFTVAGIYLILTIVLILVRKRLFLNVFKKFFTSIITREPMDRR